MWVYEAAPYLFINGPLTRIFLSPGNRRIVELFFSSDTAIRAAQKYIPGGSPPHPVVWGDPKILCPKRDFPPKAVNLPNALQGTTLSLPKSFV